MAGDERGLSLAGLLVSLLVLAVLAGGSVAALSLGGGSSQPGVTLPAEPGVAPGAQSATGGIVDEAADIAAQQNLDAAVTVVDRAAASGSYAGITPTALEGMARGLAFTNGASSDDDQASLATSPAAGGSVTLALRASDGTCFFAWTASTATWFGAEPGAGSCSATPLVSPPPASTPGPGHVGWQQGTFPSG